MLAPTTSAATLKLVMCNQVQRVGNDDPGRKINFAIIASGLGSERNDAEARESLADIQR